jgi:pyruvate dehydrogenase E1 component alpha subunit/2-oxoisovalerate dehydrogenase E1 component alpha subunit
MQHAAPPQPPEGPIATKAPSDRHVARLRLVSARMVLLQRAARIASHHAILGEEPAIVGATLATRETDWVFPGLRAWGAALVRGMSIADYVHGAFGSAAAAGRGHAPPDLVFSRALRVAPSSGVVGAHLPQAVGAAWAAKIRKDDVAAVALFDEAATMGGDFHNAMNFAGVIKAPCVFVCIHGGSTDVAAKAVAYGLAHARVDGMDAEAVRGIVGEALRRAADGKGATLVDAVTRPVSVLDDAALASDDDLLRVAGEPPAVDGAFVEEIRAELDAAVAAAEAAGAPLPRTIFDDVYASVPAHLEVQRAALGATGRTVQ